MHDVYSINFDRVDLPYFVTLTYHEEWPSDPSERHAQVKALVKRLERIWGPLIYYWRLEFKPRLSGARVGEIAPHLHLLLWFEDSGARFSNPGIRLSTFRNNLAWCWNEIVDPDNFDHFQAGTSVEPCKNLRHLTGYLSKYVAKTEQIVVASAGIGRVWGKHGVQKLPRNPYFVVLTPDQWIKARRAFAGYSGQRIFSPRPRDGEVSINGMSAYLSASTALRLLRWLAGPAPPRPGPRPLPSAPGPLEGLRPRGSVGRGAVAVAGGRPRRERLRPERVDPDPPTHLAAAKGVRS